MKRIQSTAWFLVGLSFLLIPVHLESQTVWPALPSAPYQLASICALQTVGGTGPPDIVIPDGAVYEIKGNANCGLITVRGTLRCAAGVTAEVKTDGIMISGRNAKLECGTAANRFDGDVTFTLRNDRSFPGGSEHGERAFLVMNGGTLDLHGQVVKAGFARLDQDALANSTSLVTSGVSGWERGDEVIVTTTSTYPDQTELMTLADDCPGSTCGVTAGLSYFHYGSPPRIYPAAGENGQDLAVDMRAYLANVERNITIQGASDQYWTSALPKGGHLMIMENSTARIDGVEFNRMGQQMILGRYPIHWHHVGLATGQYVRNSAIRNSPSRCVALHNTHQADVRNNLCYDITGHAIFLENGNEVENTLVGNLVVDVIAPGPKKKLLQSDIDVQLSRWRGPAGFWIANAGNTVSGNVVVNAGTGYWHPYIHKILCYDDPDYKTQTLNSTYGKFCDYVPRTEDDPTQWNVEPVKSLTLLYKDNVAYSTRVGHTWDGAPDGPIQLDPDNPFNRQPVVTGYAPGSLQTFDGMHAYKQGKTGVYYRGLAKTAHIKNSVVAEAPIGWFGTGSQEYFDSVFVGISENYQGSAPADEDFYYHADSSIPIEDRGGLNSLFKGWGLYDGSNHFRNVTFDYPAAPLAPMYLNGQEITPTPISIFGRAHFANHVMEQIHFVGDPYRRITYDAQNFGLNWKDAPGSESNHDMDGSLFGAPGFLRPDIAFNDLATGCVREANNADSDPMTPASTVLRCQPETQSVKLQMAALNPSIADRQLFKAVRLDTGAAVGSNDPQNLFSKFQVYPETQPAINYSVLDLDFQGTPKFNLIWIETLDVGDWTPLIVIDGATATNLAPGCANPSDYVLENWPNFWPPFNIPPIYKAQSGKDLRNFSDTTYAGAYYQDVASGSLLLKLQGKKPLAGAPYLAIQHKAEGKFELECP